MGATHEDPDRGAVRRVLAGEASAFEEIVRRWQGPLVNLAYRYCRHPGMAEELAQEAFLRAFRGLGRWRERAAFSTWLFAVALNVYRSQARRVRPPEVPLEERLQLPAPADTAADAEEARTAERVRRMVCALPPRYRDVLVLHYFEEMDVAATAARLGLREGTVKARLHRGRALLGQRLRRTPARTRTVEVT